VNRRTARVIESLFPNPPAARPAARAPLARGTPAIDAAIGAAIASCERYAEAYVATHRAPIGCDAVRGPILLGVLRGVAALAPDDAARERITALVSAHALDLEE